MEEHMKVRLEKLKKIEELGIEVYPYDFNKTNNLRELIAEYSKYTKEELEPKAVKSSIAGRIVAMRKWERAPLFISFMERRSFRSI